MSDKKIFLSILFSIMFFGTISEAVTDKPQLGYHQKLDAITDAVNNCDFEGAKILLDEKTAHFDGDPDSHLFKQLLIWSTPGSGLGYLVNFCPKEIEAGEMGFLIESQYKKVEDKDWFQLVFEDYRGTNVFLETLFLERETLGLKSEFVNQMLNDIIIGGYDLNKLFSSSSSGFERLNRAMSNSPDLVAFIAAAHAQKKFNSQHPDYLRSLIDQDFGVEALKNYHTIGGDINVAIPLNDRKPQDVQTLLTALCSASYANRPSQRDKINYLIDLSEFNVNQRNSAGYAPIFLCNPFYKKRLLTRTDLDVNISLPDSKENVMAYIFARAELRSTSVGTIYSEVYQDSLESIINHPNFEANALNVDGDNLLQSAMKATHGKPFDNEIVRNLVEGKQIDINHRNKHGMTALHYAALSMNASSLESVKYLIENGAKPTEQDVVEIYKILSGEFPEAIEFELQSSLPYWYANSRCCAKFRLNGLLRSYENRDQVGYRLQILSFWKQHFFDKFDASVAEIQNLIRKKDQHLLKFILAGRINPEVVDASWLNEAICVRNIEALSTLVDLYPELINQSPNESSSSIGSVAPQPPIFQAILRGKTYSGTLYGRCQYSVKSVPEGTFPELEILLSMPNIDLNVTYEGSSTSLDGLNPIEFAKTMNAPKAVEMIEKFH